MPRQKTSLIFRAVDVRTTPAGRIVEAAHLSNGIGAGNGVPRRYPVRAAVLLVRGGGHFRDTRGFSVTVQAGDLLVIHPRIGHSYGPAAGDEWEEWYVAFSGPVFDALETCGVLDLSRPVWRLGDLTTWLARFKAIFPPAGRAVEASDQVGALAAWLLRASAHANALAMPQVQNDAWLTQAQQRLATPGEEYGDLPAVARFCGLGYETFRKRFTILTGESPARYRRRLLILRAQCLMRERDLPDRAIAAALGFCDEFHFSKTFKQISGSSPRQWRLNEGKELSVGGRVP